MELWHPCGTLETAERAAMGEKLHPGARQSEGVASAPLRYHRVLQGALQGRQLAFTFPSAPDPLFKASKAPFLTLRVATLSGAPCQALLDR